MGTECREVREIALVAGGWIAGFWLLARLPPPAPIPEHAVAPGREVDLDVSVIIPARDEANVLGSLLDSLRRQGAPPAEIIVVDDDSKDATAAVAAAGGARVIAAGPLVEGWTGKSWACHQGAAAAGGSLLIFLDADVTLASNALARLVGEWRQTGGLISAEPFHVTERLYERLSAVANIVSLMGTGAFVPRRRPAGRPALAVPETVRVLPVPARTKRAWIHSPPAMAFGPCMIMHRDEYARAGGHAHPDVRGRFAEDIALARRFADTGQPVRIFAGRDVVGFRMYPGGLRQLVDGWTRVLASGIRPTRPVPAAGAALWVTAALLAGAAPLRAAAGARSGPRSGAYAHAIRHQNAAHQNAAYKNAAYRAIGAAARASSPRRPRVAMATYAAFSLQAWWMMRRVGRFGAVTALAFPVPLSTFVVLFARSAIRAARGRPTRWKDRAVVDS